MPSLDDVTIEELRQSLANEKGAADQGVMTAIGHKQGVPKQELADWFDVSEETIDDWIDQAVSEAGQIDPSELRAESGRRTEPEPLDPQYDATVEYLNYQVLSDYGWDLDDDDLFEKADEVDLDVEDHGTFRVGGDGSILEAAESEGFVWPYSCRGGACANCAVVCKEGEIYMPTNQILPAEAVQEQDVRLTCIGRPASTSVKIVYNAKHQDYLEDILLPPQESAESDHEESEGVFDSLL